MGYPTPPQSWEMVTGTWGTDANRESVIATSGGYSLRMDDTAVATKLRSGWIAVEEDIFYQVWALVRSDDITAGYTVAIKAEEYGADKSTLLGTTTIVTGAIPTAANAWEWVGATYDPGFTARWVRLTIEKTTNAHNLYWDKIHIEKSAPGVLAARSSTQSIPSATWTTVEFNSLQIGGAAYRGASLSSGLVSIPIGGQYAFAAAVEFDDPSGATTFNIRIVHNKGGLIVDYYYGTKTDSEDIGPRLVVPTTHVVSSGGQVTSETFSVEVYQDSGSAINIIAALVPVGLGHNYYNHFTAHRINPI